MQATEIRSRRLRLEPSVPTDAISGLSRTMSTADTDAPMHDPSVAALQRDRVELHAALAEDDGHDEIDEHREGRSEDRVHPKLRGDHTQGESNGQEQDQRRDA